jgi:hypothetical protein
LLSLVFFTRVSQSSDDEGTIVREAVVYRDDFAVLREDFVVLVFLGLSGALFTDDSRSLTQVTNTISATVTVRDINFFSFISWLVL